MREKDMTPCPDCGMEKQKRSKYCVPCGHKRAGEKLCKQASDPVERFWSHVDKSHGPDSCWTWDHVTPKENYGRFKVGGKKITPSRYSYTISVEPIPDGMCVLHKCDNPPCVNPSHLFLGTIGDNVRDAVNKGRMLVGDKNPMHTKPKQKYRLANFMKENPELIATGDANGRRLHPERYPSGERVANSKLTWDTVREIRTMHATGKHSLQSLGNKFGVSKQLIHKVIHKQVWVKSNQP